MLQEKVDKGNILPNLSSGAGLFDILYGTVAMSIAKSISKSSPDFSIPKLTWNSINRYLERSNNLFSTIAISSMKIAAHNKIPLVCQTQRKNEIQKESFYLSKNDYEEIIGSPLQKRANI